MPHIPRYWI